MGLSHSHVEFSPVVETKSGPIRGKVYQVGEERIVDGYLGIPYAEPPIGERRFKKPEAVKSWNSVKDCLQFGPRSPQFDEFFSSYLNIVGKDEASCLTLNVLAPRWKNPQFENGLPVMVWIHGGGFAIHSSSNYGDISVARNLCIKDVIFVSINYRLGALGFFTTGDAECRGNFGLWDQTLALQWVHDNISLFGGDPNNVTLFGQSAGGGSVDLLSLSPHSQHLFRRVIAMAGSAENEFAIRTKEAETVVSREFVKFLGYSGDETDSAAILKYLRVEPVSRLELGMTGMHEKKRFIQSQAGFLAFVPNLDGDFFPAPIAELRRKMPKKEVMTGTTEWEGLFFAALANMHKSYEGMKKFARVMLKKCDYGEQNISNVREEVVNFYLGDSHAKDHEGLTKKHMQMLGDLTINNGIFTYAKKMAHLGHDVYFYSFEYSNPDGFGIFRWLLPFRAATHCTEIRYVLGKGVISKFRPNDDDRQMINIMSTYFTNFAKFGNPNGKSEGKWVRHSSLDPFRHMKITLKPEMAEDYQGRRADFWHNHVVVKNETHAKLFGQIDFEVTNKL